ncbi:hypothetical protein GCM10010978_00590 [Compostibacillus humi]|uniref:Fumarylacetoacetase-like C-terminal domain-containing protein n=1 Tax=Compostibacillus humi TaxID=1245525 RepID=A0A8J2ZPJ3_9BACI|nr:fumarylacetoacetate hydrolase family protein [Compostibacillus humi]GGH68019.1 hypothetical protein GCM10010978_00590 [Compostibacillus humi]
MKIIRFKDKESKKIVLGAVTEEEKVYVLPYESIVDVADKAKERKMTTKELIEEFVPHLLPVKESLSELDVVIPVDAPEVWASGVTYFKSKEARNYEATDGKMDATTFYDKVYDAERPEIFFKSTRERTIGPNQILHLRSDSNWQVPEPELGLVLDGDGNILGYTIGNDMSCRDIEGENPLYLPQAKIWSRSCSVGPAILLAEAVEDPYNFNMTCRIYRNEELVFEGSANTNQLKRRYEELVEYLRKDNIIFPGTVLLTGTCIVPPNDFTLHDGDRVDIEVEGIGTLSNTVTHQKSHITN